METQKFTRVAIWLHWLIALGFIANIALAWAWELGDAHPAIGQYSRSMVATHKSIGITILGLAVLRLLWRFGHRPPAFPHAYRPWERATAHVVHWGLYLVMLAMPISGWVMSSAHKSSGARPSLYFGTIDFPQLSFILNLPPEVRERVHDGAGAAHGLIAWLVYALILLHVAGALKHQFEGHAELQRMGLGR